VVCGIMSSAQRRLRILTHREEAAHRSSARTRSRSAELERREPCGHSTREGAGAAAVAAPRDSGAHSQKRPRMLAPMQRTGLSLEREAQDIEEQREQSELSHVLSSFASEGATRHGRSVELELNRIKDELSFIKDELSPQQDKARQHAALPPKGTKVVLTGLVHGGSYNGREAVVVDRDGRDRLLVQVCGASELCQLSVRLENVAIVAMTAALDASYDAGRDFSQIHELATLHARQNAKREVQRLAAEADEQRRAMEHAARTDSLLSMNQGVANEGSFAVLQPLRQRCRHGSKCAKPDCMDLHPWESDWVEAGANSGCDSKSKFRAAKGIYNLLTPVPRAQGRMKKTASNKTATSPSGSPSKDSRLAGAAVEIDRILAQAGVPIAARQAAHENVIPLLCSHGRSHPSMPAKQSATWNKQGQKLGQGRLGGVRALRARHGKGPATRLSEPQSGQVVAQRPMSLQELQSLQKALQQSLDGGEGMDNYHQRDADADAGRRCAGNVPASRSIEPDYGLGHIPSWRDHEDPDSRRSRVMQRVEIKKAELRKKKLMQENAMLQEALVACGAVLSDSSPWPTKAVLSPSEERSEGAPLETMEPLPKGREPSPTKAGRERPRVVFEDLDDIVFVS
jgi:hypothetical protein